MGPGSHVRRQKQSEISNRLTLLQTVNILVTGGAGFIGSNLLHYWTSRYPEDSVTCLDLLTYAGHMDSIKELVDSGRIRFIRGDIRDGKAVASAMEGMDAVIHLAAESHVDRSIASPHDFLTTNVMGTMVLLEEARRRDLKRFHHVSTDEVFGSLPLETEEKFTERSPYAPNSPYAASKASSDHLVRAYSSTYGIRSTVTNCGNNYGPRQHPEKLIPRCLSLLLTGGKAPVYGSGRNVRDWIYVEDHCSAIDAVLHRGREGGTYLVSGGFELSNIELVRRMVAMLGLPRERIEFVADRPGHDLRYALDDSRLRGELGWKPSWSFEDGLQSTVRWYRENAGWWRPFTGAVR